MIKIWSEFIQICCTRSGVTRSTLFVVLFLCRMCRCGLNLALWSHISSLMRLLAAEPHSIARLLFTCQYLCGTIVVTPCSMVWDLRASRQGQCLFIGLAAHSLFVRVVINPFFFLFCIAHPGFFFLKRVFYIKTWAKIVFLNFVFSNFSLIT